MHSYCNNKPVWIFLLSVFFLQSSYSQKISQSVRISYGAINGVFIEKNGKTLVVYGDPKDELKKAEMVLFYTFSSGCDLGGTKSGTKRIACSCTLWRKVIFYKGRFYLDKIYADTISRLLLPDDKNWNFTF